MSRLNDWCPVCDHACADLATHECPKARRPAAPLAVREVPALPALDRVKALLAECVTVDEAKDIRDQAVAVAAYYRQRSDALELQNSAAEIRIRAERRLGELLASTPRNPGHRYGEAGGNRVSPPVLEEIGITKRQSSMWQRIAAVAEDAFEDRLATAKENGLELTTFRVLNEAKAVAKAAERLDRPAPVEPLPPHRALARRILSDYTRAEVDALCAILTHGTARDEQPAAEVA